MDLKIVSWESKGLRCPDGKINLAENGYKRFNFIQMPNATGKTTYLELIQYALSGYMDKITPEEIGKYFHVNNKHEESFFELIYESDGQKVTSRIDFQFDKDAILKRSAKNKSKVKYSTSYSGQGGFRPGWNPPKGTKRMLNYEFVKLFIFDGEFAEKLFDSAHSKAFQCLDSICQLNILDELEKSLDKYFKAQVIETDKSKAKTPAAITKAVNEKEKLEEKINKYEETLVNNEKEIQRIKKEVANLEKEINEDDGLQGSLKKDYEEKKEIKNKLDNEHDIFVKEYFDIIKNPINLDQKFVAALDNVQEHLYKLKIPASATKAFFEELIEDKNCICDREMNEKAKSSINKNKEKYFDEDRAGIYNNLKTEIREKLYATDFDKNLLEKKNDEFKVLQDRRDSADGDLQLADQNRKQNATGDLAKKMSKKDMLIKQKEDLSKEIDQINNNPDQNINLLKKERTKQDEIIKQVEGNIALQEDVNKMKAVCNNVKIDVKKNVKNKIINDCNIELKKIFSGKKLLQIENIEEYITLKNQSSGSVGQKLSIGILYLSVLLSRENVNFFTIFDSPCGPIDLHVRKDLSEPIVDLVKKNGQFITFVQSSERQDFTTEIEKKVEGKQILYLTIFDKERFSTENLPSLPENKYESSNAWFVRDKHFFNQFNPSTSKKIGGVN